MSWRQRVRSLEPVDVWAGAAAVAAIVYGSWLRIDIASKAMLHGDEFHSLRTIGRSYPEILSTFDRLGSGLALPLLQRVGVDAFGHGLLTYRWPAVLCGVTSLVVCLLAGRSMVGWRAASLATCALALSPISVYYSHFGRSYAMLVLLSLLLAWAVTRMTEPSASSAPGWFALAMIATGLLPWAHITSASMVIAIAAGGAIRLGLSKATRDRWRSLAAAIGLGAMLAVVLHLPVWRSMVRFVGDKSGWDIIVSPIEVMSIMAGGAPAAVGLVAVAAGALLGLRGPQGTRLVVPLAAVIVPITIILVLDPAAREFGYARYLLVTVPFFVLLAGWVVTCTAERAPRFGRWLGIVAGQTLVIVIYMSGPLAGRPTSVHRFANAPEYLVARWNRTPKSWMPAFYESLADDKKSGRIIEAPPTTDHLGLYAGYARWHGKDVWLGHFATPSAGLPVGPHVLLSDPALRERSDADYLVVHTAMKYEQWFVQMSRLAARTETGPARVPTEIAEPPEEDDEAVAASKGTTALERRFGEPIYRDDFVTVWRLR